MVMQFMKSLNTNDLFRTVEYQPKIVYWGFMKHHEILTGVHETLRDTYWDSRDIASYLLGFMRHREILTGVHEHCEILTGVQEALPGTYWGSRDIARYLLGSQDIVRYLLGFTRHREILTRVHEISRVT